MLARHRAEVGNKNMIFQGKALLANYHYKLVAQPPFVCKQSWHSSFLKLWNQYPKGLFLLDINHFGIYSVVGACTVTPPNK